MRRLLLVPAFGLLACTPGPEDHGDPQAFAPLNEGEPYPYYQGIPDSYVPDAATSDAAPADTSGGGATDTSVPMCPSGGFGIPVPCPG